MPGYDDQTQFEYFLPYEDKKKELTTYITNKINEAMQSMFGLRYVRTTLIDNVLFEGDMVADGALPRSLATTGGISVDVFSWPYLDVSVQAVPLLRLFDSTQDDEVLPRRVPPFGDLRI